MIVQNKKTLAEYPMTQEEWRKLQENPLLKNKFKVVDSSEVKDVITSSVSRAKIIMPEEIVNYKKDVIDKIKEATKTETTTKKPIKKT